MKAITRVSAAAAAILLLLAACAPGEWTFPTQTPEGVFRDDEAVGQALDEAGQREPGAAVFLIDGERILVDSGEDGTRVILSPGDDRLTETVYAVDEEKRQAAVVEARYRRANGDWYVYKTEDTTESEEPLWLKLPDPSPANVGGEKSLPAALAKRTDTALFLTLGEHTFYYTEDEEGGVVWYLEASLSVVFPDKGSRDAFRRQHPGGDAAETDRGEFLWQSRALLKLTGADLSCFGGDEIELLRTAFSEPCDFDVALGEGGEILSLSEAAD